MRLRIAAIAMLLALVAVAMSWMTFQPVLASWLELSGRYGAHSASIQAHVLRLRTVLPWLLALDVVFVVLVCYLVLDLTLARPLQSAERTIEQIARLNLDLPVGEGGPLLSRLQQSIRRMAEALAEERGLTRRKVEELMDANSKLAQAQTELLARDRLATVGKIAAGVAHEVGNPLAGILGYLTLLRRKTQETAVVELIERVEAEVLRIDNIVRSLLQMGRPSASRSTLVSLAELVESCVRLVSAGSDFAQVQVALQVPKGLHAWADPGALSQILINLLINAAQASGGSGGQVAVDAQLHGEQVELTVADSGPGLSREAMARLFEPFFSTKAPGKGTGLGLVVSCHLARQMGGDIIPANRPEGGAIFTVVLPLHAPAPAEAAAL